jgi:hypothetical protein
MDALKNALIGDTIRVMGGSRNTAQLAEMVAKMGDLEYLPEVARELLTEERVAKKAMYLSPRNPVLTVGKIKAFRPYEIPQEITLQTAGLLIMPNVVAIIDEMRTDHSGVVFYRAMESFLNAGIDKYEPGVWLEFSSPGPASSYMVRLFYETR